MTRDAIPDEVGRFILTSVPSVPYLEAVLLLRRQGEQSWTPAGLAQRLYLPEAHAAGLLQSLRDAGIAQASGPTGADSYRYAPPAGLSAMLDQVAHHYATNLRGVTDLIHSRIERRAYDFANAFRWRKDT